MCVVYAECMNMMNMPESLKVVTSKRLYRDVLNTRPYLPNELQTPLIMDNKSGKEGKSGPGGGGAKKFEK